MEMKVTLNLLYLDVRVKLIPRLEKHRSACITSESEGMNSPAPKVTAVDWVSCVSVGSTETLGVGAGHKRHGEVGRDLR